MLGILFVDVAAKKIIITWSKSALSKLRENKTELLFDSPRKYSREQKKRYVEMD